MKTYILYTVILLFAGYFASAHSSIEGKVVNSITNEPVGNASVTLNDGFRSTVTDHHGNFAFKGLESGTFNVKVSYLRFKTKTETIVLMENEVKTILISFEESPLELSEIIIGPEKDFGSTTVSGIDINLRPVNTSQDLLRIVPGLFIAQHAGGGKSEQIFLRGFDIDHGTDINISVDGMPVNMVSHAHGQGYADLHFLIPETVDKINFSKGPYQGETGDFMTAGAVGFQTKNRIGRNMLKMEAGRYDTYRGLGMFNLLPVKDSSVTNHSAYLASEYSFTNGYVESPQNFNRINILGKYNGALSDNTNITATVSTFTSSWDASGQIPERAVESRLISRLGSLDATEGGRTSRQNASLQISKSLSDHSTIKNQVYFINYNFELYSNFTFFLEDSVNGDQIKQKEHRNIFGYNGSYTREDYLGNVKFKTVLGYGFRNDEIRSNELSHSRKRRFLNNIVLGNIGEFNGHIYLDETVFLSPKFTLNAAVRFDQFYFRYEDLLTDSIHETAYENIVSPKISLYYTPTPQIQFFIKSGTGFHSNDARVVVVERSENVLPKAYGADIGSTVKLFKNLILNTIVWGLDLESEFVYVGDAGIVEPSGRSRRYGLDVSARYQLNSWLYFDTDLNITKPRLRDEPKGADHIPLAPVFTSIGGVSFTLKNGLNGSVRYRYLADRPANEDNSVVAYGYFINDAVVNYTRKNYQVGISAENIFNVEFKEAQFDTESRLLGEIDPVSENHYTPGRPFFIKGSLSLFF